MTLSIKTDPGRAGGGYALLEGPGLAEVTAISVENCSSGQFLGEDGRWKKAPFAFPVEPTPSGALSLGPHIVDFVPTELLVSLHTQDGRELGRLFWTDVLPSRNPGAVTSTQVYEERRRQAEAKTAEDAARLKEAEARKTAEDAATRKAAEDADRKRQEADAAAKREREKAEAEQAARTKAKQDEDTRKRAEDERRKDGHRPAWGRWALVGLLVLVLGAAAAFAFVPGLRDLFHPGEHKEARVTEQPTKPPPARPVTPPQQQPTEETPPPAVPKRAPPVDCARTFNARLDGLQRLSDEEKLTLGKEALRDGCGLAAFRAFDVSAWESDEEAAWNLARFYDPNETKAVYRDVGQGHHPDWAAVYYRHWRGRSERQAAALRTICETANSGGASLQRSCAR